MGFSRASYQDRACGTFRCLSVGACLPPCFAPEPQHENWPESVPPERLSQHSNIASVASLQRRLVVVLMNC
jgi:hypothetical protein